MLSTPRFRVSFYRYDVLVAVSVEETRGDANFEVNDEY
jgi:hypothetical protein